MIIRESWVDEVQVYSLGWREQKDRLKAGGAQLMLLVLPGVSSHPNIAQRLKCLPAMWESWVGKIPWRRAWQPTVVFLAGESP